eukprot:s308_g43.t2
MLQASKKGDAESSEASRLIGSLEMLKQLEEQLKDQSSKFQLQSEERQRLELQLQQQKKALQRLEGKTQVGAVAKAHTAEKKEEEDEKKEAEKKELEKAAPKASTKGTKGKAKGKGSATPPCKGKGKAASEEPRMPEVTPKTAMKKLFWNPLKLGETRSIWEQIWRQRSDLALFDVELLEANFAEAGGTSPQKRPSTTAAFAVSRRKRRALEEKRRRELWFMLVAGPLDQSDAGMG